MNTACKRIVENRILSLDYIFRKAYILYWKFPSITVKSYIFISIASVDA